MVDEQCVRVGRRRPGEARPIYLTQPPRFAPLRHPLVRPRVCLQMRMMGSTYRYVAFRPRPAVGHRAKSTALPSMAPAPPWAPLVGSSHPMACGGHACFVFRQPHGLQQWPYGLRRPHGLRQRAHGLRFAPHDDVFLSVPTTQREAGDTTSGFHNDELCLAQRKGFLW